MTCDTNQRAEIHERGVVPASTTLREERRRELPKVFSSGVGVDTRSEIQQPCEEPGGVRLYNRNRRIKRERHHGICRVTANSWQHFQRMMPPWNDAAMSFQDDLGCAVKIPCAGVVPETLPSMKDVGFRRSGERFQIRETTEPAIEVWNYCGDLGLLKHQLGDEDRIRIPCATPRQITAVFAKPGEKRTPERARLESSGRFDGKTSNVQCATSNADSEAYQRWTFIVERWTFRLESGEFIYAST